MQITEAMFQLITQRCLKNPHVIDRLNKGLINAGITKQFKQAAGVGGKHFYEKVTFEGHQALKLLEKNLATGEMAVVSILKSMWPSGDADGEDGSEYVTGQTALWEQWSKVVVLMKERNPDCVAGNQNGFSRFGKECRDFCFRFQSMYHEEHCRSFYLHTLMHHAGDMMRELQEQGMCLGMMANSGAERRHEYGRHAAKKALAGGCWRKKIPELARKQNIFAYLTLREILLWQHGTDLVSHELARRAAQGCTVGSQDVQSRRDVKVAAIAEDNLEEVTVQLPSKEETQAALNDVAEITNEYPHQELLDDLVFDDLETAALSDASVSKQQPPGVVSNGNQLQYVIERDTDLFRGRDDHWEVMSQESAVGSEDYDDCEDVLNRARDLEQLIPDGSNFLPTSCGDENKQATSSPRAARPPQRMSSQRRAAHVGPCRRGGPTLPSQRGGPKVSDAGAAGGGGNGGGGGDGRKSSGGRGGRGSKGGVK